MVERVMVEAGGFSSGVYYGWRRIEYGESATVVEERTTDDFKAYHGSISNFGNFGVSVSYQDVPRYERVLVEVEGYTRIVRGKPQRVKGAPAHRWKRVDYYPEAKPIVDKDRDTRGGEARRRRR